MKYFLDSAIMEEIEYAYKNYAIDGITTNPNHVRKSGKSLNFFLENIVIWLKTNSLYGENKFPVSVEIDPNLKQNEEMVAAAEKLSKLCPNFVIKLPCNEQGVIAAHKLEQKGIRTNVTLVFSGSQAIQAGRIGAKFVSPFIGWKESSGEETAKYIADICKIYRDYNFKTEIIAAALRTGKQLVECASSGVHITTCGLAVYKDSFEHPFTKHGLGIFCDAWDNTPAE